MAVKLANVVCISVFSKDNCLFRNLPRSRIEIIRQSIQLALMAIFLIMITLTLPFISRFSNNSDWISRVSYVVIAFIGLLIALKVPGSDTIKDSVLLFVTMIVYVFNIYFIIVSLSVSQRLIKRFQQRLDFSIDIFSPHLDTAKHVSRRIWQESLSTILLASNEYRMEENSKLVFASVSDDRAPYLLAGNNSVGERLVENIKIMSTVGLRKYLAEQQLQQSESIAYLRTCILADFVGPDCYWKSDGFSRTQSYFGRAAVIPFPFAVVFYYDDSSTETSFDSDQDLQLFILQNRDPQIRRAVKIRRALRALEGSSVTWPHTVEIGIGTARKRTSRAMQNQYSAHQPMHLVRGTLRIERHSDVTWKRYNLASGFQVYIDYSYMLSEPSVVSVSVEELFGINYSHSTNIALDKFFHLNRRLLSSNLGKVQTIFQSYRRHLKLQFLAKEHALSYSFLTNVMSSDIFDVSSLAITLESTEQNSDVRSLVKIHTGSLVATEERIACVSRNQLCQRWFLLWDDLWRRNRSTIPQFEKHTASFSPFYKSSICYFPLSRTNLLDFLNQHDLDVPNGRMGFFHTGFINQIYFVMDELAFGGTAHAIPLRISTEKVRFSQILGSSTGTTPVTDSPRWNGDGTALDDPEIRLRAAYPFEDLYHNDPSAWRNQKLIRRSIRLVHRFGEAIQNWMGLNPIIYSHDASVLMLSLRREHEAFELPRF